MKYTLILLLLLGCQPSTPGSRVDDPRAYLLEHANSVEMNSWISPYRIQDPAFMEAALDDALKWKKKGLPHDQKRLDKFLKRELMPAYRAAHLKTPEGRALVLANARTRSQAPPMVLTKNGRIALLDFWVLPGEWKKAGRASTWQMRPTPRLKGDFLPQADLQRAFKALVDQHPNAKIYEVRFRFSAPGGLVRVRLVYDRVRGVLWHAAATPRQYAQVGLEALVSGTSPIATLGYKAETRHRPGDKGPVFPVYRAPKSPL